MFPRQVTIADQALFGLSKDQTALEVRDALAYRDAMRGHIIAGVLAFGATFALVAGLILAHVI